MQRITMHFWKHICIHKYLVTWHRRTMGGRGRENPQGNRIIEVGFLPVSSGKAKGGSGGHPAHSVAPGWEQLELNHAWQTWSSKCTSVIPQLQPSCPGVLAFLPCSSPALLFLLIPQSRQNHPRDTCCSWCECFFQGRGTCDKHLIKSVCC